MNTEAIEEQQTTPEVGTSVSITNQFEVSEEGQRVFTDQVVKTNTPENTMLDLIKNDPEVQQAAHAWQEATYLLVGAILHKHGRRAIDLSQRELQKFAEKHQVRFSSNKDGSLRYEVVKRKAGGGK